MTTNTTTNMTNNDNFLKIRVPTYRSDVHQPCDVAEDILRIYGYNNLETPPQIHYAIGNRSTNADEHLMNAVSDFLTSNGFNEIMTLSFNKAQHYQDLQTYPTTKLVRLKNPSNAEYCVMRQTMLLGGLETIAHNINHRQHNLRLYEAGNVYSAAADTGSVTDKYAEERHLALFITGLEQEKNWNNTAQPTNFFTLKNILERLLTQFNVDLATLQTTDIPADIFADGIAYKLMGQPFLEIGVAAPAICRYFDIKQEVYFAQMRWKVFTQYVDRQKVTYTELPKYPEVHRDLAILIDKQISFAQLHRIAFKTEKRLLKKLTLFDVYEGGKLPDDKKSYALSFVLQDSEKTLSDNEIDTAMKNLMSAFQRETGATLR